MRVSERMIEAAAEMVEKERDDEVARIQAALAEEGEDFCIECDDPISAARKAALPSAERCIHCQEQFERNARAAHSA